jgi:hypothetical protein
MQATISPRWRDVHSAEFDQFTQSNGLGPYLSIAKDLATRLFQVESGQCEFVQAGDSDDEWIVVRIQVKGTIESVLESKRQYTAQWVAAAPVPQRHLIRLSMNIV